MYFFSKNILKVFSFIALLCNIECHEISDNYYESVRNYLKKVSLNKSVSEDQCLQSIEYILENYPFSAVQYIDSAAKLSSGLTGVNLFNLGDFDMCYGLENVIDDTVVHGKYCLSTMPFGSSLMSPLKLNKTEILQNMITIQRSSPTPRMIGSEEYLAGIHYAYCFPSTCSAEDIQELVDIALGSFAPKFYDKVCYSKDTTPELSGGAIFTIVFIAAVVLTVLLSTVYEYYLIVADKKPPHGILLAFSAYSNGKKLITSSNSPDQLLCLNGIRAITMAWVILGHENSLTLTNSAFDNLLFINQTMHDKANMWLMAAPLSVDTFFTVGGLVTMYSFLKANEKSKSFNVPLYYIHRYLRLTPAFAVIILIHVNLLVYLGNGPLWNSVNSNLVDFCAEHWWSALLYIQNFVNPQSGCVPQSWYLSVDFQIFLLSPIVLYPLSKWPKVGLIILFGILIPFGFIIPTVITYSYELVGFTTSSVGGDFQENLYDYAEKYYIQSHTRFGPYVIGMAFGLFIYKLKSKNMKFAKTKKNVLISLCIWLITLSGLVACVYGGADLLVKDEYDRLSTAFYNGFNRNAWAIAVGLMILLCVCDFGGPINAILSFPIFQFITKISYSMYLVHYCFIGLRIASLRKETHYSIFGTMHAFWGDFMFSMVLSILFCLCFESPIIILEKYLLGNHSSKSQKNIQKSSKPTA